MKQSKQSNFLFPLVCLLTFIALIGCYEPSEGCVEYWAVNYNVLADNLCDDCCTAPKVNAKIEYILNDSTSYGFGDTILLESGTYVTLHSANVMLSHFELDSVGELVSTVNDSVEIDEVMYEQDFGFSSRQGSSITLTEYQEPFAIRGISFLQGLHPSWQDTSIFGADNTIIAEAIDSLYVLATDDFTRFSCTVSVDTINQDTVHSISSLPDTISFHIDFTESTLNLGENTTVTLSVNVKDWFEAIVFDGSNTEGVADELLSVLPDVIVVE